MRILIDMNLSPRWVDVLADAGIVSIHWSSVGETTASDSFIMAFAKGAGYVAACLSYFERVPGVGASHTLSAYPA